MLFIYWDTASICIAGVFILFIPLVLTLTVFLVKKVLILCFCYLYLLSNILLLQYVSIFHSDVQYTLEYSVYIDMLTAIACVSVLYYWKRIPKEPGEKQIIMQRFRKWFICMLSVAGIFVIGCLLAAAGRDGLSDRFRMSALGVFSAAYRRDYSI